MKQMIMRARADCQEIEVLKIDELGREYFETIDINELITKLDDICSYNSTKDKKLEWIDDECIAASRNYVAIKQDERKRVVSYRGKAYQISFPNSIYIIDRVNDKINSIDAYSYVKYEGKETELYQYPMPNMLSGNRICMGSAPKNIVSGNVIEALERVLFTQYSHDHVDNVKAFKETTKYFEYLSNNSYPYEVLIKTKFKLKEVLGVE